MGRQHNVPACPRLQAMAARKPQVRQEVVDSFIVRFCFSSPDLRLWIPNDGVSREVSQLRNLEFHTGSISARFRQTANKLGLFFTKLLFCRLIGFWSVAILIITRLISNIIEWLATGWVTPCGLVQLDIFCCVVLCAWIFISCCTLSLCTIA